MIRGSKHSEETKRKIGLANKGRKHSARSRRNMSLAHKGQIPWSKGKKPSVETRRKISLARKGYKMSLAARQRMSIAHKGHKHWNWLGGISRAPYAWAFNKELKAEVRRRDGQRCQLCGVPQAECRRLLDVHHVDYRKKNSDPVNLTTLCASCNSRVNVNRAYWTAYFQALAIKRGGLA